jgi:CheY-like chemotaxis protein
MLVSGDAQPADQVRARLAGGDAFLAKPLSRGSVARALEASGVPLPADARRL